MSTNTIEAIDIHDTLTGAASDLKLAAECIYWQRRDVRPKFIADAKAAIRRAEQAIAEYEGQG